MTEQLPEQLNSLTAKVEDQRHAIDWLRDAATQALLDALAIMDPAVAVPFTESPSYRELQRAIKATDE